MEHGTSVNRVALSATLHCLTGCAIGEVLGLAIGTALGWSDAPTIALAVGLAFLFGYSFTFVPLVRGGMALEASAQPRSASAVIARRGRRRRGCSSPASPSSAIRATLALMDHQESVVA